MRAIIGAGVGVRFEPRLSWPPRRERAQDTRQPEDPREAAGSIPRVAASVQHTGLQPRCSTRGCSLGADRELPEARQVGKQARQVVVALARQPRRQVQMPCRRRRRRRCLARIDGAHELRAREVETLAPRRLVRGRRARVKVVAKRGLQHAACAFMPIAR